MFPNLCYWKVQQITSRHWMSVSFLRKKFFSRFSHTSNMLTHFSLFRTDREYKICKIDIPGTMTNYLHLHFILTSMWRSPTSSFNLTFLEMFSCWFLGSDIFRFYVTLHESLWFHISHLHNAGTDLLICSTQSCQMSNWNFFRAVVRVDLFFQNYTVKTTACQENVLINDHLNGLYCNIVPSPKNCPIGCLHSSRFPLLKKGFVEIGKSKFK